MPGERLYTVQRKEEIRRMTQAYEPYIAYRIWATSNKTNTLFSVEVPEAELSTADAKLTAKVKLLDSL